MRLSKFLTLLVIAIVLILVFLIVMSLCRAAARADRLEEIWRQ